MTFPAKYFFLFGSLYTINRTLLTQTLKNAHQHHSLIGQNNDTKGSN